MLDAMSMDQLRTFIAAAEEGSFSAAGRKLRRAQSVVSQTLANLEAQLGVLLFDREGRRPTLTAQGQALLRQAREVVGAMDMFKTSARGLAGGREPELAISNGGLDANWLTARGIPTVTLGCGQRNIHTALEQLDIADFHLARRVALRRKEEDRGDEDGPCKTHGIRSRSRARHRARTGGAARRRPARGWSAE